MVSVIAIGRITLKIVNRLAVRCTLVTCLRCMSSNVTDPNFDMQQHKALRTELQHTLHQTLDSCISFPKPC